MEIERYDQD
jgi:hypothetical protein